MDTGGDVCCLFEIELIFIGLVHNQITPPRVGITVLFSMTSQTLGVILVLCKLSGYQLNGGQDPKFPSKMNSEMAVADLNAGELDLLG